MLDSHTGSTDLGTRVVPLKILSVTAVGAPQVGLI